MARFPHPMDGRPPVFDEHFDGVDLDRSRWLPHYLPAWSSAAASAATYAVRDSCLHLSIPADQGCWLAAEHAPLRVSAVQSGNQSGAVGSATGQQPWRPGVLVREQQTRLRGWLPHHGYLEMTARATLSPRSMAAWWLVGFEERPEESAEICVWEIFGDAVEPGRSAAVGAGLHAFRDPAVIEDFAAPRVAIDVAGWHHYAVDWTVEQVRFFVDEQPVRSCRRPPDYPMQLMIAVFDFPERSNGHDGGLVPELVVDRITGWTR